MAHRSADALAARLLERREKLGLTQRQIADAIGVRAQTIDNWESGESSPRIADAPALCAVLRCSARWLVLGDGRP